MCVWKVTHTLVLDYTVLLAKHGTVLNGDEWVIHMGSCEATYERLIGRRFELEEELILNLSGGIAGVELLNEGPESAEGEF